MKFSHRSSSSLAVLALGLLLQGGVWAQGAKPEASVKVTLLASPDAVGQNGLGDEIQIMTQAVIDDYNDAHTGPNIELQVLDSKNTDEKTLAKEAAGSIAILSCVGKTNCLMQAGVAKALDIPLIGPMSGDESLRGKDMGLVFPVRPSDVEALTEGLSSLSTMRIRKLGVLVQDDDYGKSLAADLAQLKLPDGLAVVATEKINQKTDFNGMTARLQRAGVTAVLILSDDVPTASALVGYWNMRRKTAEAYTPVLMHLDGLALPAYADKVAGYPGGAMFVTVVPNPWGGRRQAQRDYQQLAQSKGIYRASYGSLEAYINARLLVTAVRNGKATTAAKLVQYLRAAPISLGGLSVRYTAGKSTSTGFIDQAVLGPDGAFRH